MDYILDFARPTDKQFVEIFEQVVKVMLDAENSEKHEALKILERFRVHQLAFNRALDLLSASTEINTRFVVAKMLETIVTEKWKVLAPEHQVPFASSRPVRPAACTFSLPLLPCRRCRRCRRAHIL
jgi:hypothetical protein